MQLKEFVNSRVETVQSHDTLQRAAEKMRELDVGSLPVCEGGQLVGMLTDRDITIRAVAKGSDPAAATVREVMTPEVLCCFENEEVEEAARIMQENQVRRILVLNEAKELVGITSLGELATATGDRLLAGETLETVSKSSGYGEMQEDELDNEESDNDSNTEGGGERAAVGFASELAGTVGRYRLGHDLLVHGWRHVPHRRPGRREDHRLHTDPPAGIQDAERGRGVAREIGGRVLHRRLHPRLAGQVDNRVDPSQGGLEDVRVAHAAHRDLGQFAGYIRGVAGPQVVDDAQLPRGAIAQEADQVRPDEPATTGDEHALDLGHAISGTGADSALGYHPG